MATTKLAHLQFWCQKVLPTVYDDSLSYYELLCKVVEQLNAIITAINDGTDVEIDIEGSLREMAEDGTLAPILQSTVEELADPILAELETTLAQQISTLQSSISSLESSISSAESSTSSLASQVLGAVAMKGQTNYIASGSLPSTSTNRKTWLFVGDSWAASGSDGSTGLASAFANKMGCNYLQIAHDGFGFYITNTIQGLWATWAEANTTYNWRNVGGVFVVGGINDVRNDDMPSTGLSTWVTNIETLCENIASYFNYRVPVYLCLNMKSQTTQAWRNYYSYAWYRLRAVSRNFMLIQPFTYWLYSNIATNYEGIAAAGSSNLGGLHPTTQGYQVLANLLFNVVNGCPVSNLYLMQDTSFVSTLSSPAVSLTNTGYVYIDHDAQIMWTQLTGTTSASSNADTALSFFQHGGALMAGSASGLAVDASTYQPYAEFVTTASNVYLFTSRATSADQNLMLQNARAIFLGYIPA